jgi:hypothetical protein
MNSVEDLDVFKLAHHLALRSTKRIQKKNYLAWRIAQARNEANFSKRWKLSYTPRANLAEVVISTFREFSKRGSSPNGGTMSDHEHGTSPPRSQITNTSLPPPRSPAESAHCILHEVSFGVKRLERSACPERSRRKAVERLERLERASVSNLSLTRFASS